MRRLVSTSTRLAIVLSIALTPGAASTQEAVIPPGREADIRALAAPYTLGAEIVPGWSLHSIEIQPRTIHFHLRAGEAAARVTLDLPERAPAGAVALPSFALTEEGDASSLDARAALVRAIRANDDGDFWATAAVATDPVLPALPAVVGAQRDRTSPALPVTLAGIALLVSGLALTGRRDA